MSSSPSIFELTVRSAPADGEIRLTAQWQRPGELPTRRTQDVLLDPTVLLENSDALGYGQALGKLIFVGGLRELFAQARADPAGLRVLLAIEAESLQSLRWERLAGPFENDRWRLLGQNQRTPLSIHLPSGSDHRFPPFERSELRALVVVASPDPDNRFGVAPFDEAEAIDTVLEGLGEIPSVILGKDPRAEGPPTLEEICRRLTAERFTLLHLVAHGAVSARTGAETAIFLDDDDGKTKAVPAATLIQRFEELDAFRGLPHLAFLSVCDSAKPDAEGAFGGLGQRLVRELGMPAVVAMTDRVTQSTALILSRGFYARLREHGEVDRALVEACVDVRRSDDVVVPALFSRIAGRPLFTQQDAAEAAAAKATVPTSPEPTPSAGSPMLARLGVLAVLAVVTVAAAIFYIRGQDESEVAAKNEPIVEPAAKGEDDPEPRDEPETPGDAEVETAPEVAAEGPSTTGGGSAEGSAGSAETTGADPGPAPVETQSTHGGGTKPIRTSTPKCDAKTTKTIQRNLEPYLQGKSCDRVPFNVRSGKVIVKRSDVPKISIRAKDCNGGTIQCP